MVTTQTVHTSWFSRLKNGLVGILIGPLLLIGMIWLLSWNEGRSVAVYRALTEGAGIVVSVESNAVDPTHEGALLHLSGPVTPGATPGDPMFGVTAEGAVGLSRKVEMYQWVEESRSETRTTLGGGEETVTTYSYNREWRTGRVDSSRFRENGHDNPQLPVDSERFTVPTATVGAFTVKGDVLAGRADSRPVNLPLDLEQRVRSQFGGNRQVIRDGGAVVIAARGLQNPAIGDLRIGFTRQDIAEASLVGAQKGGTIVAYRASNGRSLLLSANGAVPATEMFAAAQAENALITWLVRVGGIFGVFIAFAMALSILGIIADVIPFVGSIVRFGTTFVAAILALIVGPLVIAIAWIAYRPLVALLVLGAGVLVAAGVYALRRRSRPVVATSAAPFPMGRPPTGRA